MASWEDDDFEPPPVVQPPEKRWEDEETEQTVKESWEEEESGTAKTSEAGGSKQSSEVSKGLPRPKHQKKAVLKQKDDKAVDAAAAALRKSPNPQEAPPEEDAAARKLRLQKLQEQADFENAQEVFSGLDLEAHGLPAKAEDYDRIGETVGKQLTKFEQSFFYVALLKSLLRNATSSLKSEDLKDLAALCTVISNERLKTEKSSKKKKAAVAPKKSAVAVERGDMEDIDAYDVDDGYDFM